MKVIIGSVENPARSTFMFCRTLQEQDKGDPRGSSAMLFSKDDTETYDRVVEAIQAAGEKKHGSSYKMSSGRYNNPLKDGDELYEDEEYSVGEEAQGMWMISASCYSVPQVVDKDVERIIDPEELDEIMVSGNYFLFSIDFKGYVNESKGVRAQLNNLMFIRKGGRLDGKTGAESDFKGQKSSNKKETKGREEGRRGRRGRRSRRG